jgi:hypothetical protein
MISSSLQEQKKELKHLDQSELVELCLRMARYKKENKELLNFLLFHQHDVDAYVEAIKSAIQPDFLELKSQSYYCLKSLRKILRKISRQAKYMQSTEKEMDLLLWFCHQYLEQVDLESKHKALQQIFIRQIEKLHKLNSKLHEELQFDYQQEIDNLHKLASRSASWYPL